MSDTANNSVAGAQRAPSSAPLQVHAWSVEYIRLKAFAFAIRTVIGGLGPIAEFFFQKVPKEVEVVKTSVPSRQPGRSIKIHIYTPKDAPKGEKLPVHLNLHGSGFVIPSLGSDREFCGEMAKRLECVVIDCDYRKAPEHPAPAQMQDAEDVSSARMAERVFARR
jgi:acetyl esterase/lipase